MKQSIFRKQAMKSTCIALLFALSLIACADNKNSKSDEQSVDLIAQIPDCTAKSVLAELASDRLVNIDTLAVDSNKHIVQGGAIYINGIGFGCNPIYDDSDHLTALFLVSSDDYETAAALVKSVINSHFGSPQWDGSDYLESIFWASDSMTITMRRLHTDEGGTVLFFP